MRTHQFHERPAGESVLTIGNFDGVHLGHQALLRAVVGQARGAGCASGVITFDPHPQRVLHNREVPLLTTLPLRLRLFRELGLDAAYVVEFTEALSRLGADEFLTRYLLDRFTVRRLLVGYDFAFGRNRDGTAEVLKQLSRQHGFGLEIFPAVVLEEEVVSSTRIREALAACDFPGAARFLGRDWSVLAEVKPGERRGHRLGFPTLNQTLPDPLPIPYGVYAVRAEVNGSRFGGVSNYGVRPTVADGDPVPVLETHLFGFEGDLYGTLVEVSPVLRLREERKFPGLDALKAQIARDVEAARAVLG